MTPVPQRGDADCGIAALAAFTGISYEDVYVEAAKVDTSHRGKSGLYNFEVIAIAARLGVQLRATKAFDLDTDEGVLRVRWNDPARHRGGHFIAVREGRVACPASKRTRTLGWREYLHAEGARACSLLKAIA